MNKKKIISLILAMTAAVACVFTLTSCDCKHKKLISTVVAPTCTEAGYTLHKCKKCGYETKDNEVEALGHTPGDVVESDSVNHWNVCTVCNGRADVTAHTYGEGAVKVQPSGTTKGSAVYTCTVCGHETTKALSSSDISHQHAYDYENMLNDNDSHWYECPTCHERTEVQPHKWDDGKINYVGDAIYDLSVKYVESTTYTCLICGAEKTVESAETSETDVVYSYVPVMHSYVVTDYVGEAAEVIVDGIHKGLPVVAIWSEAFKDNKTLTKITLPNTIMGIAAFAFEGCENLAEVNVSEFTYFTIGKKAFYGCGTAADEFTVNFNATGSDDCSLTIDEMAFMNSNIKSIYFPEGETVIDSKAFYGCEALSSVDLRDNETVILDSAFENCTSLNSITLPGKTRTLGEAAFRGDTALNSVKFDTYRVVVNKERADEKVIDKTDLTEISAEAFLNCSALTSITIPKGVATIGEYAFASCTSVTSVELDESVNKVNDGAFYNCVKIADLTVEGSFGAVTTSNKIFYDAGKDGSGITLTVKGGASIPENFFMPLNRSNVPNITEIKFVYDHTNDKKVVEFKYNYLPNVKNITVDKEIILTKRGTTDINSGAFKGCENLETITLPLEKNIGYYFDSNNYKDGKEPKNYTKITQKSSIDSSTKYYVPSSLKTVNVVGNNVPDSAFSGCERLYIDISEVNKDESSYSSSVNIGDYAFEGCDINHITLSDNLENIGDHAFENCANITDLTKFSNVTGIGSYAFANTDLTSAVIPSYVDRIASYTFKDCEKLTSVDIHNEVYSVGAYAFENCSALTSVAVPNSVTSYGDGVFYGCNSLTTMTLPLHGERLEFVNLFKYYTTSTYSSDYYNVPSSLTTVTVSGGSVGSYAFQEAKVTNVDVSKCTSLGNYMFDKCYNLTSVTFPAVSTSSYGYGRYFNEFTGNANTNTITINGYTRHIPKNLRNVTIKATNNTTTVGSYAFQGFSMITSVTLDGITTINSYAFDGCSELTSVTIPNSVTSIGSYAFDGCSGLTSVTIPNGVTSIGSYAFRDCIRLTSIKFNGTVDQWNAVSKGSGWDSNTGAYTVHCTGGDVQKS